MARYLITGGAGFIGSAMARKLLNEGHEVHLIDLEDRIDLDREKLLGAHLHIGDISKMEVFSGLPREKFDVAFHMAAQTSARISEENPELDIDSNVKGTYYFCKWAREAMVRRVVFTSSMAVYGSHGDNINEDATIQPVSVYGITKVAGESFIRILSQESIEVYIYRLFNVYGPGQDYHNMKQGMLSIFLTQALTTDTILVTGSLDRYRDFVYIDDVIDALLTCESDKNSGGIFNVGSGKPTTVKQLCNTIINKLNSSISVVEVGSHRGDVFGNYANPRELYALGWEPSVDLEQGIETTMKDAIEVLSCK